MEKKWLRSSVPVWHLSQDFMKPNSDSEDICWLSSKRCVLLVWKTIALPFASRAKEWPNPSQVLLDSNLSQLITANKQMLTSLHRSAHSWWERQEEESNRQELFPFADRPGTILSVFVKTHGLLKSYAKPRRKAIPCPLSSRNNLYVKAWLGYYNACDCCYRSPKGSGSRNPGELSQEGTDWVTQLKD